MHVGRHVPPEAEGAVMPGLEDLRVAPEPRDLLVEPLELARLLDGGPEEITETHEKAAGLPRIFRDQTGDGVESVEQEVRLEVRAQVGELRLAPELLRLERGHACALDRERIDE